MRPVGRDAARCRSAASIQAMSVLELMGHDAETFVPPSCEIVDTAVILYSLRHDRPAQGRGVDPRQHGDERDRVVRHVCAGDRSRLRPDGCPHYAAAVPFDRPDVSNERRLVRRDPSRAASPGLIQLWSRDIRARADRHLDSGANNVLGAAATARGRRDRPLGRWLRRSRSAYWRGAHAARGAARGFEDAFKVRILEGYGLSETAPVLAFNQVHRPSKPGTVGLPIFGVEIRCVDEADHPVPWGVRGEVVARGPNVMKGYYGRPEETAEALRGRWFHTGDIGLIDGDGYLAIVDRRRDMILRGGFDTLCTREIEEVLMTHPAVALCAVVGVPDERLGEEIKAFVVKRPSTPLTDAELIAWSREQMAAYTVLPLRGVSRFAANQRDGQDPQARAPFALAPFLRKPLLRARRGRTACQKAGKS